MTPKDNQEKETSEELCEEGHAECIGLAINNLLGRAFLPTLDQCPLCAYGITLWNALGTEIKTKNSVNAFEKVNKNT